MPSLVIRSAARPALGRWRRFASTPLAVPLRPAVSRGRRLASDLARHAEPTAYLASRRCAATHAPELPALLAARPTTVYVGFDPSARSLHVGNLMMLVTALVFQCYGHRTLALVGGATGQIGDPSGKHAERPLQNKAAVAENTQHIKDQIAYVMGHARAYAARRCGVEAVPGAWQLVDNARWWSGMGLLDFFRDVGKHMRMGAMISKDAVRSRMATEDGLSLTEFCYQSLQAYDFCHLYEAEQCQVQLGGSDQWGNIIAGIELVKKRDPQYASKPWNERMYGMTLPLLTTETGKKYGKSEGNAVWLDPTMTSPYDLWQFLRRTPDTEVARMLQLFTLVPQEELAAVMQHHAQEPRRGLPQVLLAREVVELVHGADVAAKTQQIVELLHPIGRVLEPLNMDHVVATLQGTTFEIQLPREEILNAPVAKIAVLAGLAPTLTVARKVMAQGGFFINQTAVRDPLAKLQPEHIWSSPVTAAARAASDNGVMLLQSGKRSYRLVRVDP